MAEETITILRIGTEEAVKNVNDLKNNIKVLKENLGELEIGTEEYQNTLDELKVNQNALKDAMYATSSSMEDVAKAATGASDSYNSLVHRMASLKEEFRATNDAVRRADLGKQIKSINDQLKEMDAQQGNFQRHVGNYSESIKSAFKDMGDQVDALRKGLKLTEGGLNGFKDGMEGIAKSPMIGTIGILVSLAIKLAAELKEDETAMAGIKKAMTALQPVMDFFSGIIQKLAGYLADLIGEVTQFVTSNGLINKVIQGVMGVGNAILKFVISPFKGVIAAIKVFKEQGVKGLGDAAKAFGREMESGIAFKQNFQAGQAAADTFIKGGKSRKQEVKNAGKDLGKDAADGFLEGFDKEIEELDKQIEAEFQAWEKAQEKASKAAAKAAEERIRNLDNAYAHQLELNSILVEEEEERAAKEYAIREEANQKKLDLLDKFMEDALSRNDLESYLAYDRERANLELEIETDALREKQRLRKKDLKDAEEKTKAQKELLKGLANATSSILGAIADMYEEDEANAGKNANKIKALRIAAATIDTISGAVGAFMQASETIPPPLGQIVGAAAAAAVTASGIAQIASMKAVKTGQSGGAETSTPVSVSAITSAPDIPTEVANVRTMTSASEEDRLNQMASSQRVYILASDIEASQKQIKTQVSESSF